MGLRRKSLPERASPSRRHKPRAAPVPRAANARSAALAILDDVLAAGRPLDESLAVRLDAGKLEPRDRAFARNLAAVALRRLGQIDALIGEHVSRPLPEKAHTAKNILRLGAAQLVFLETPGHAAVNETVGLSEAPATRHFKGLINAVLRRLAETGAARAAAQDAPRLNTPDWLWQSWEETYGAKTVRRIAEAHLAEPPLDFTVKGDAAAWAERLEAEVLPTGTLRRRASGAVPELPGFAEGAWWVQDAAAALPARLLGDVRAKRVADLGAAPGGKTAQLAAAGARVTAVEQSQARATRLGENLARLQLAAEIVVDDAAKWQPAETFDAVLIDAPCSATGTIRRHPDLPWRKSARDVAGRLAMQDRLLANAAAITAPGGILVYAVCSLEPSEGPARIAKFLAGHPAFRRAPITPDEIGGSAEFIARDGTLRTLPCHWPERGGLDGFYVARFRRDGAVDSPGR